MDDEEDYGAAPGGERALTEVAWETASVATQLAAILDTIEHHRGTEKPMSPSRVAHISAMIDDLAVTLTAAALGIRRRRRMLSARWYEEVCRVGEGGFGTVVRAPHRSTGQHVAVKTPRRSGPGGHEVIMDLLREACFLAACRAHPSLLVGFRGMVRRVDTSSRGEEEYSIVMDYIDGSSLAHILHERGQPFPEEEVRRIMRQLLRGASAMHENGIVHRDINPSNIFVDGDDEGIIKIGDYGCAKSTAEARPPFCVAGTNGYMAPEVLVEDAAGHGTAADMWSLGCVMAELLTDTLMFDGDEDAEQLCRIFDVLGVPEDEEALRPRVLEDLVRQQRVLQRLVGHRQDLLRRMVPEEMLSLDGFEVLRGLLACDPRKRLTAHEALRLPWFTEHAVTTKSWSAVLLQMAGRVLGWLRATTVPWGACLCH
ncbi:hypothetical protein PR202_gb23811 [Eleusine coracana subsp. coracana]|uniref:Protein kinase domain-containing protein n=1 Tax=Eleusine coracana subsp. coracana TaxID=191504 RepID=A0AAV5FK20_ELECO|nr:hypothetical protein PR202_gb23811 [Eleusine coracana subsp. coracana]